jgi:hypothetical protein
VFAVAMTDISEGVLAVVAVDAERSSRDVTIRP